MHKVFISYHHDNDQNYKELLLRMNGQYRIFVDKSVDIGDISDDLDDQTIRRTIRDDYLQDSTVTILLVGTETRHRKHVDWELYSSMIDGSVNKKSGILVVSLPSTGNELGHAAHGESERSHVYPGFSNWITVDTRAEYECLYPYMPERITDNLLTDTALISVVPWAKASIPENLRFLINATFEDRGKCKYDLSRPMRRKNSSLPQPSKRHLWDILLTKP